jgi:hypothetical protein
MIYNDPGYAGDLVTFAFDPAYASNPSLSGSNLPINANTPGFDVPVTRRLRPLIRPSAKSRDKRCSSRGASFGINLMKKF